MVVVVVALVLAVWAAAAFALLNFIISGAHQALVASRWCEGLHGKHRHTGSAAPSSARFCLLLCARRLFPQRLLIRRHCVCANRRKQPHEPCQRPRPAFKPGFPSSDCRNALRRGHIRPISKCIVASSRNVWGKMPQTLKCPRHFDWGMSGAVHFVLGASVQNAPKCPFVAFRSHEVLFCIYR